MPKEPKPTKPQKEPKAPKTKAKASKRLRALIAAPLIGAKTNHALFITSFAANIRAVLKSDWPKPVTPGVEVDTFTIDADHQHVGLDPFPVDADALTVNGECRAKQGPDQLAATRDWLIVQVN